MSKQSELNAAYRQVRNNYLRNIRSMERRGYTFDRDMRPTIPKRITEGSIRKLQRLNERRYDHASFVDPYTGEFYGKGQEARKAERSLAQRSSSARTNIDQLGGALMYAADQATPGGSTETFFKDLQNDLEGVSKRAERDSVYAVYASTYLDEHWEDIQRAFEYINLYKSIEAAPERLVDWLVIHIRELQGKTVTQEDMRTVGMLSEDADYYPTE